MSRAVLALDQGTTSSRAIVFGRDGGIRSVAQQEFPQLFPQPGHVEHDPEAIWETQLATARDALNRAQLAATDVAALGVTNQRETTVLWDRDSGRPVANAIVWQSRITAADCERLKADGLEPLVRERTGLVLDPYFSATKIRHLLRTIPGLRSRAERGEILFGTIDSFLIWRLTGGRVHATDVSNASRTMLFDIRRLEWDDELLRVLDVPRAMLPEVKSSSEVYGHADPSLLGAAIPIGGAAGDQQAALFGQAAFRPGAAKNTYGTGCFLLLNTGSVPVASRHGLVTTVGWRIGSGTVWCLEGSVFVAGAVVQWLRDGLGLVAQSADVEPLAASVEDHGGVYFVPAFTGLGAPDWDPTARGTIVGLSRGTTAGHLARAAVESMAFQTRDVLDAMRADSGTDLAVLQVDGGASRNDALMQFQADLLGARVRRPTVQETTALGAASLAGLAVGFWESLADLERIWALDREFVPQGNRAALDARHAEWRRAVARSRGWAASE